MITGPYNSDRESPGSAEDRFNTWLRRFGAWLIDIIPIVIIMGAAQAILLATMTQECVGGTTLESPYGSSFDLPCTLVPRYSTGGLALFWVIQASGIAFGFWNWAYRQGNTGRSLGKQLTDISIVSEATLKPIGFGMSFLRQFAHVFDTAICGVGYLLPLFTSKQQTLADMLVKTIAIRGQSGHTRAIARAVPSPALPPAVIARPENSEISEKPLPSQTRIHRDQPSIASSPGSASLSRHWLWSGAAAAVVAITAVAGFLLFDRSRSERPKFNDSLGKVTTWDDTLYPQEIALIPRTSIPGEITDMSSSPPNQAWTSAVSNANFVSGGDAHVILVSTTSRNIVALDPTDGHILWISPELPDPPDSCAALNNRIGCVVPPLPYRGGTVVFFDAGSGTVLNTVNIDQKPLSHIYAVENRFVAISRENTPSNGHGFAVGYAPDGKQIWARETQDANSMLSGSSVLVDGDASSDTVRFIDTTDGREILQSSTPPGAIHDQRWGVFRGGVALRNSAWTGTDIYDNTGKKISSVSGWEPAKVFEYDSNAQAVPILTRINDSSRLRDPRTLAAVNPSTGHLLWRITDPMIFSGSFNTFDDVLIVKMANPNNPPKPDSNDYQRATYGWVRAYDTYTGEMKSPIIEVSDSSDIQASNLHTNGKQLIGDRYSMNSGFNFSDGAKVWQLEFSDNPTYVQGRMYVTDMHHGTVSLYQ